MNVRVYKNADAIGAAAAALFAAKVIEKPNCVLGLATGSTPLPTYRRMAALYEEGAVFSGGHALFTVEYAVEAWYALETRKHRDFGKCHIILG